MRRLILPWIALVALSSGVRAENAVVVWYKEPGDHCAKTWSSAFNPAFPLEVRLVGHYCQIIRFSASTAVTADCIAGESADAAGMREHLFYHGIVVKKKGGRLEVKWGKSYKRLVRE